MDMSWSEMIELFGHPHNFGIQLRAGLVGCGLNLASWCWSKIIRGKAFSPKILLDMQFSGKHTQGSRACSQTCSFYGP